MTEGNERERPWNKKAASSCLMTLDRGEPLVPFGYSRMRGVCCERLGFRRFERNAGLDGGSNNVVLFA